jgi:NADPH-dependent 2,4-dienoyl-CoA reductase/sulfur reductase-like enzyme
MERILGREMGDFIRALHEEHGVVFHLKNTASAVEGNKVRLSGGSEAAPQLARCSTPLFL